MRGSLLLRPRRQTITSPRPWPTPVFCSPRSRWHNSSEAAPSQPGQRRLPLTTADSPWGQHSSYRARPQHWPSADNIGQPGKAAFENRSGIVIRVVQEMRPGSAGKPRRWRPSGADGNQLGNQLCPLRPDQREHRHRPGRTCRLRKRRAFLPRKAVTSGNSQASGEAEPAGYTLRGAGRGRNLKIEICPDLGKHQIVELRGLEPLASCMPCLTNPSGVVRDGQSCPGPYCFAVRRQPAPDGMVWARSHLVSHWVSGPHLRR